MNKLNKYIQWYIALLVIALFTGCNVLDVDPKDALGGKGFYQDDKDAFAVKTGLYNTLQSLVEEQMIFGELRADLISPARGAKHHRDYLEFMDNNVSAGNKFLDWTNYYTLINQCNDALESLPMVSGFDPDVNQMMYNHIYGEILWLRSWAYFSLVRNWGDVPFITKPVLSVNDAVAIAPTDENIILDQLEDDLMWASKHVFVNWGWGKGSRIDAMWNHETVNMCATIGLLADVLIYRDKFEEAWTQDVLLKILTKQQVNRDDPSTQEDWHNSFNLTGGNLDQGKEWFNVMFRYANERYKSSWREQGLVLAFDSENYGGGGGIYNEAHQLVWMTSNDKSAGGAYIVKPSEVAVRKWKLNVDEFRGEGYSYYIDKNERYTDTLIWKNVGIDPEGNMREPFQTYGNVNILRTAHLYLKGAEVANRLGHIGKAIELINECRLRVSLGAAPVNSSATIEEVEDAIMEERALELAFEGERWYDLVRIAKRRNDPNYLIDRVVDSVPASERDALRARLQLQALNGWKLPYGTNARQLNPKLN
ncbi:RagB/SusD family nutrient uptake outer membrane protein [Prolixibacteraceae bacterium JC049]|nr:RagB/SusD family nutrient uptake outer membrane protein [Prolixibacteraceae bacterium JC049]